MAATLFIVFFVLAFLGVPIAVALLAASAIPLYFFTTTAMAVIPQRLFVSMDSFSLMALPFFMIAGGLMAEGGVSKRLVNFAKLFVGWIPGSLAQANVVGNMLFGALSGSSVAAASAMGGCIYPIQKDEGYDPAFATAVNIASAPTGLLIPPTSAFIVYSTVAGGVSISTLFMAGTGHIDGRRLHGCSIYLCEKA